MKVEVIREEPKPAPPPPIKEIVLTLDTYEAKVIEGCLNRGSSWTAQALADQIGEALK